MVAFFPILTEKCIANEKSCNVWNKWVNLPKILAVFMYGFIKTYIYLYPIYYSNLQVNKRFYPKHHDIYCKNLASWKKQKKIIAFPSLLNIPLTFC